MAYERNIESLEEERMKLEEKLRNPRRSKHTFMQLFEPALQFLSNPCKLRETGNLDMRKMVLRLVFIDHFACCPEKGFLTKNLSLPFRALGGGLYLQVKDGGSGGT